MRVEISCVDCGTAIEYDSDSDEPSGTVSCDCGARYAITISQLRTAEAG